jgi:branched-chain amino acid transport system permease protein
VVRFVQQLIDGLASGSIYASLALALVLILRSTNVVNFAQGEMAMFSTYVAWQMIQWGAPVWLGIGGTLVIAFIGAALIERLIIRPVEKASVLTVVIVTLGLLIVFNSTAAWIWKSLIKEFPSPFPNKVWAFGKVRLTAQSVGILAVLVAIVLLLYLLFQRTKVGLAMRAAASNAESSRLVGVSVGRMLMLGWGLAAVLGALSGVLVAPKLFLEPNMMASVLIYAFAAATLGGFDSPVGAVIGGLIVGVSENLASTYIAFIGPDFKIVTALVIIIAVLLVRPTGLFGSRQVARV